MSPSVHARGEWFEIGRRKNICADAQDAEREEGLMRSKRQTTMAKLARERKVQERRALKQEKKQAAAAARSMQATDSTVPRETLD